MSEPTTKVLIVEDEASHGEVVKEGLERAGHLCSLVDDGAVAIESIRKWPPHVVVSDYQLGGDINGLNVIARAKELSPWTEGILITAHGDEELARDALKDVGAFDYIKKPIDLDDLRRKVDSAARKAMMARDNLSMRAELAAADNFDGIVAASGAMKSVLNRVRRLARTKLTVLIYGESGTGKDLIARSIHRNSDRRDKAWVPVNCAGISESLIESELFGHVKGSFTNALTDRKGHFETADGGTIFLDEIGELPLAMQAKLLRVLESGEIIRVGSSTPIHVDVRVVAATNRNLKEAVEKKTFREDLFFRINQAEINLLPLRDRREDILPLIEYFWKEANAEHGRNVSKITPDALRMLHNYDWPGNIRELRNVINLLVALCEGDTLDTSDLASRPEINRSREIVPVAKPMLNATLDEITKIAIEHALQQNNGNRERTAKQLGIPVRTLYRKLKEYDLN